MELIEVEATEDRARIEGGHALILLRGIADASGRVRFRLRAIDEEGWPLEARQLFEREHEPLAVENTADGLLLSIGPELAANPFLLPGTAMEITLAHHRARGEFLWPAITPPARAKRRNIMTKRMAGNPLADAARAAPPVPSRPVASSGAGVAMAPQAADTDSGQADTFVFTNITEAAAEAALAAAEHIVSDPTAVVRQPPVPGSAAEPTTMTGQPMQSTSQLPIRRAIVVTAAAARPAEPINFAPPVAVAEVSRGVNVAPAEAPAPVRDEQQRDLPVVDSDSDLRPPRSRELSSPLIVAATALLVTAGAIVGLRAFGFTVVKRQAVAVTQQAPMEPVSASSTTRSVYDVFAAGPRSPRGTDTEAVSPAKALQLAHALLHGPQAQRDPEEAVFWLQRYLASMAGTEHARIALTQLGSAYAQPVRGTRDLRSALIAWELAGALGDPVAMCFLAAIHESALGVPGDPGTAAAWYRRAAAAGGTCASGAGEAGKEGR